MVGQLLLALSILIVLHEWGHFQTARWFGIKVEKFFLFFDAWGKKLFSFKKGETEYGVGWLPLGGYVKISGMIDESMDKEFLKEEAKDHEFRAKPAWQRLIVMLGGVTVNAILGVVLFTMIALVWGVQYIPIDNVGNGIVTYEIGKEVGFKDGDKIVEVNGEEVSRWSDIVNTDIILNDQVRFTVNRNGEMVSLEMPEDFAKTITADRGKGFRRFIGIRTRTIVGDQADYKGSKADEIGLQEGDKILELNGAEAKYFDQFVTLLEENAGEEVNLALERDGKRVEIEVPVSEDGKIGIKMGSDIETAKEKFSFGKAVGYGVEEAVKSITELAMAIKQMIRGKLDPRDSLSGPIQIATIFGAVWDWEYFWLITAKLSMILAFMNLLPIPALDGGHVFFLLIEMVRGKPLSDKALERAQIVGFVILVALMVFIFGNDIYQLIANSG